MVLSAVAVCGAYCPAQARGVSPASAATHAAARIAAAYEGPVRVDLSGKQLSGKWDFRFDAQGQGEREAWFAPDAKGAWKKAAVPGSYNFEFARNPDHPNLSDANFFYQGKAWYRTRFQGPRTGKDIFLHLAGTVLRQKVWLNGQLIGGSALPWLDVAYDVSDAVARGAGNTLVIEVDNSILPEAIPDEKWHGWWDDGGLIRPVYLEERPGVRAQSHVTTTMEPGGRWRLAVETAVHEDRPVKASIALTLRDRNGRVVWHAVQDARASGGDAALHARATLAGVRPWSPEHPALYRLTVRASAPGEAPDVTSFRIGFRQIETRGTQILLNGQPIILRGINRHEFAPGVGQAVEAAQNLRDLRDIKSLGTNFVRLTHYSQSQDVYDDCDELGLLVWTEIPAWQSSAATLASPQVWKDDAAPQLEEMVRQHRNHPSVIIWSVANEIPSDKPEVAGYVAKAIAYVRQLDPSRLVTFASSRRDQDISMGTEDVISVNEYFGWYYGAMDEVGPMLDTMHAKYPDKPILVSEYGSEGVAGWSRATAKPGSKDYSYAYQARLLASHLAQIYALPRRGYVAGGIIWVYNDFPDPHRFGGDQPESSLYRNSKGLVTMDRVRKPSYAVVKNFFSSLMRAETPDAAR